MATRSRPIPVSMLLRRQIADHVVRLILDELHEDQVPELAEPLLVHHRATVWAVFGSAVVEDLRRRTARSGHPHLPEVVPVPPLQPLRIDSHLVEPDRRRLVIALVDGEPDTVGIETEVFGGELIRPRDGLFLEVVPKAEVPQHLEEGEMANGRAHHLDVHGARHLLRRHRPVEWRRLLPQEVRLEGDHPGVGEQQSRVDRDQRRRRSDLVATLGKEVEELLADLAALHGRRQVTGGPAWHPPVNRFRWLTGGAASSPRGRGRRPT